MISSKFIGFILIIILAISGYFYLEENKFIKNSTIHTGSIILSKNIPKARILTIKLINKNITKCRVPFWHTKKTGDKIRIRISNTSHKVKINKFIYLHKMSVSIVAGSLIILSIVGIILLRSSKH